MKLTKSIQSYKRLHRYITANTGDIQGQPKTTPC